MSVGMRKRHNAAFKAKVALEVYLRKTRLTTPAQPFYLHLNQPVFLS